MKSRYQIHPACVCAATLEAYRIPGALDLFCRLGSKNPDKVSEEAQRAGYTSVALLPEKAPLPETPDTLKAQRYLKGEATGAKLLPLAAAVTEKGTMAEIGLMNRMGETLFCVPDGFESLRRLRALFCYASDFGVRIAVAPCIKELCEKGQIHEGDTSDRLGMKGIPALSETLAVGLMLGLAREHGVALHLRGISCAESLDQIRAARQSGQDVTCDVAVMNLIHTDTEYNVQDFDNSMKLWPAVRTENDRLALWKGIDDGVVTAIVTNHRARSGDEMALPFEEVPFGSEMLADALAQLMTAWDQSGRPCSADALFDALSVGPARVCGHECEGTTLICLTSSGWQCLSEK